MERTQTDLRKREDDGEDEKAMIQAWNYIFGFVEMAVVKCAIELKISDTIENHGSPMTLTELSSTLNCSPSYLHRIMRFLVHRGIFKENPKTQTSKAYAQTPLSRLLMLHGENNMAALILLESSPTMLSPWHGLSGRVLGHVSSAFESAHGEDIWSYAAANPAHSQLINDAMACGARRTVPAVLDVCPDLFDGIESLVDVGGGNGTTLNLYVKARPKIKGINFDLPHVVFGLPECDGVKHVGGNMFESVPKADAAYLNWVLHDWGDEECIQILKKCKEAIPKDKGKVIIVEAVIEEEDEEDNKSTLFGVKLMLDMVMIAHTNKGKERTRKEWIYVIEQAGFSRYTITPIQTIQSVIQAFP